MPMRIKRISNVDQLSDSIRSQWNQLPLPSPMQSADWLLDWWRTFGNSSGNRLFILVGYDEYESIVAIAPWYVTRSGCLRFLGDGMTCSDHATILTQSEHRTTAPAALAEWLTEQAGDSWHTMRFESVDADDGPVSNLLTELANAGFRTHNRQTVGCWARDLPSTWDEFLASLSKNHRKRCRRWKRQYFDSGRAKVTCWPAEQIETAWRRITTLNLQRRAKLGDRSAFADKRFHLFHLSVLPELLESENAELRLLRVDGNIVAVEYVLQRNGRIFCYQSGMKTTSGRDGYGNLSILSLFHDAIQRDMKRLDFLRGDESYKSHWGAQRIACVNHYVAARSLKGAANTACYRAVDLMLAVRNSFSGAAVTS